MIAMLTMSPPPDRKPIKIGVMFSGRGMNRRVQIASTLAASGLPHGIRSIPQNLPINAAVLPQSHQPIFPAHLKQLTKAAYGIARRLVGIVLIICRAPKFKLPCVFQFVKQHGQPPLKGHRRVNRNDPIDAITQARRVLTHPILELGNDANPVMPRAYLILHIRSHVEVIPNTTRTYLQLSCFTVKQ